MNMGLLDTFSCVQKFSRSNPPVTTAIFIALWILSTRSFQSFKPSSKVKYSLSPQNNILHLSVPLRNSIIYLTKFLWNKSAAAQTFKHNYWIFLSYHIHCHIHCHIQYVEILQGKTPVGFSHKRPKT